MANSSDRELVNEDIYFMKSKQTGYGLVIPYRQRYKRVAQSQIYLRPNIEIDWALHGRVKSYDEVTNRDLDQSYADVIEAGLDELEAVETPDRDELLADGSLENVRYTRRSYHGGGLPTVLYSKFLPYSTDTMYVIRAREHRRNGVQGQEELFAGFARASPYIGQGVWSIGQVGGHWNGQGLADYYAALNEMDDRYDRDEPDRTHHSETATYIAPIKTPGSAYLVVDSQPSRGEVGTMGGNRTRYLHIDIVTDGIPVDDTNIRRAVGAFGYRLENAQNPQEFLRLKTRVNATLPQITDDEVVEIIMEEDRSPPPYPKALITENPFRKVFEDFDEDTEHVRNMQTRDLRPQQPSDDESPLSEQLEDLLGLDRIYVDLRGPIIEPSDTVNGYSISSVDFAKGIPIGGAHTIDSLWVEAEPNFVSR